MALKFGTSGLRGEVKEMTDRECYGATLAFLKYLVETNNLNPGDEIAIAGDLRPSTDSILEIINTAIIDSGYQTINCGKVPTPTLSFFAFQRNIPSIMVTGSHIPFDMNGIKFNMPFGEVLKSDEPRIIELKEKTISELENSNKFEGENLKNKKALPNEIPTAKEVYKKRYLDSLPEQCFKDKKIVFYGHSSVGRDLLPEILEDLGAEVIKVNYTDKFTPIDTEAIRKEDLELAKDWVTEHQPDVVFSADGDSDRPMIFDEKGQFIRGDLLGVLSSIFLKANSVSLPVSSNTALEKTKLFKNITRTKIGSPYVIEGMNEAIKNGIIRVVSYEANGGFLTADEIDIDGRILKPLPTRDALLPLIAILMLSIDKGKAISEITSELLPQRFVYSSSIKGIPTENSLGFIEKLKNTTDFSKITGDFKLPALIEKIDFTDGARMYLGNDDIVHLRPSGNAPELRCYSESDTEEKAKILTEKTLELAKEKL